MTLPDLSFQTTNGRVSLGSYFEPCAPQSRLLVIRVSAAWCGTCRWEAAHTAELLALDIGHRLQVLELLIANDDNGPAAVADVPGWQARLNAPTQVALDPLFRLAAVRFVRAPLPLYVLVDTRTMKLVDALDDPHRQTLILSLRQALAKLDGTAPPQATAIQTVDGFTPRETDMLREMSLPEAPPPDPTNAKADDPDAALLGALLFSDPSLSPSGTVACATCHDPSLSFADGRPQSLGVALVDRNAPSILLASHSRWQFWDGRADTLWAQALGPLEDAKEVGSSRLFIVHAVFDRYRARYEAIFGTLPPLSDAVRFPPSGKPGEASWASMTAVDQAAVTRVYVNVGKAIAAFERTLRVKPNALDRYAAGDLAALSAAEKKGLQMFFTAGCVQCHYGPRLTDDAFHVVRFPTGRQDGKADDGREGGIPSLLASEFRADGVFSDAPASRSHVGLVAGEWTTGAFRTPALRGITSTGPYGHGGTLATLAEVLKNYSTGGLAAGDPRATGKIEPWVPLFSQSHADELLPLIQVLSGDRR